MYSMRVWDLVVGFLVLLGGRVFSSLVAFSVWELVHSWVVCTTQEGINLLALIQLFGCFWWVFESLLGEEAPTCTCLAESGGAGELKWLLYHKLGFISKAGHGGSSLVWTWGTKSAVVICVILEVLSAFSAILFLFCCLKNICMMRNLKIISVRNFLI